MNNKLQELTDKLYQEGLSKGKEEGERLLEQARAESEAIVLKAREQARSILEKAEADSSELKSKAESDIRMASEQSLQTLKKEIEQLFVNSITDAPVEKSLSDAEFLKTLIGEISHKFDSTEQVDISVVLPESLKADLESWVKSELSSRLKSGIQASFSKKIQGGFRIGPSDGSYFISLTDDSFKALIKEYLRPVTRKILFGE